MSCSERHRGGEEREYKHQGLRRSVDEAEPNLVSQNGSLTTQQLTIDENLLVDPKVLFIGSKIGEGAHGKVYEGRICCSEDKRIGISFGRDWNFCYQK